MESYWEDITPEKAAEYLSRNAAKRHLKRTKIAQYARDMSSGGWHPSHQGPRL
jgi:hypothetical protein